MRYALTTSSGQEDGRALTVNKGADEVLRHGDGEENAVRTEHAQILAHIGRSITPALFVVLRKNGIETSLFITGDRRKLPCR